MNGLILYTTEDGHSRIQLRADGQTVWLTQREMAELFDVSTDTIGLHLKNLYDDGELAREATTEESSVVAIAIRRRARLFAGTHFLRMVNRCVSAEQTA